MFYRYLLYPFSTVDRIHSQIATQQPGVPRRQVRIGAQTTPSPPIGGGACQGRRTQVQLHGGVAPCCACTDRRVPCPPGHCMSQQGLAPISTCRLVPAECTLGRQRSLSGARCASPLQSNMTPSTPPIPYPTPPDQTHRTEPVLRII